ncbi:PucR family transcriptional regulator [Streptomyces sp. NPDC001380]|uniref:PucR family transcriptional regulator n=1 Tax=Streptomyces sp. NPDC001380 TaxID=3364566 RepID=UPI003694F771
MAPDGREAPAAPSPASTTAPVTLDEEEIGTVWLERPGPPGALDGVLLDRLAMAAAAVVERYGPARTTMADPALVELAVSPGTDEAARARALQLLGFAAGPPLCVAAVRSRLPLDRVAGLLCPARPVKAAALADVGVVLAAALDGARLPAEVRAGIGAAAGPDRSWREARTALRFTTSREPVVRYDELGAPALLAEVPRDAARGNADVAALARVAGVPEAPEAPETLETLEAYCAAGSLRRAAGLLHLHHRSVARRLGQLGETLGVDLAAPTGLVRVGLALTAWRLLNG